MKLDIIASKKFRKDLKRIRKRGWNIQELNEAVEKLAQGQELEAQYYDHALAGSFNNVLNKTI